MLLDKKKQVQAANWGLQILKKTKTNTKLFKIQLKLSLYKKINKMKTNKHAVYTVSILN